MISTTSPTGGPDGAEKRHLLRLSSLFHLSLSLSHTHIHALDRYSPLIFKFYSIFQLPHVNHGGASVTNLTFATRSAWPRKRRECRRRRRRRDSHFLPRRYKQEKRDKEREHNNEILRYRLSRGISWLDAGKRQIDLLSPPRRGSASVATPTDLRERERTGRVTHRFVVLRFARRGASSWRGRVIYIHAQEIYVLSTKSRQRGRWCRR